MILPQSLSLTIILLPGTAWQPGFHHSGSRDALVSEVMIDPEACFASQADNRIVAPRPADSKDLRMSFRLTDEVRESCAYKFCSVRWNVCRILANNCKELRSNEDEESDFRVVPEESCAESCIASGALVLRGNGKT